LKLQKKAKEKETADRKTTEDNNSDTANGIKDPHVQELPSASSSNNTLKSKLNPNAKVFKPLSANSQPFTPGSSIVMAQAPLQNVHEEEMSRVPVMWFPRPGYVSGPMGGMPIEGEENYFRGGPYPMYPGAPYGVAPVYPPFQPVVYTTQTSSTPPGKRFVNGVPVGNQKTGIPSERPDFFARANELYPWTKSCYSTWNYGSAATLFSRSIHRS